MTRLVFEPTGQDCQTLADSLLLSDRQVAALLSCSRRTVWKMASCGDLPKPVRVGSRTVRWRRTDIEAWVANGCQMG